MRRVVKAKGDQRVARRPEDHDRDDARGLGAHPSRRPIERKRRPLRTSEQQGHLQFNAFHLGIVTSRAERQ